jgi:hypothetical protein
LAARTEESYDWKRDNPPKSSSQIMNHEHHHHHGGQWIAAAHATLHCSIGCIVGETRGLMLGTTLNFSQGANMVISTVLACIAGFSLAVFPLMRRTGMNAQSA